MSESGRLQFSSEGGNHMTDKCIYCGKEIIWLPINGKKKPFDDPHGSTRHHCSEFKQNKIPLNQRVIDLEEKVEGLKNLTSKILSKIDAHEKQGERFE